MPRIPLLALAAFLASAFLFAAPADARKRGGPMGELTAAQQEVRTLKHEIAVLELYNALNLDAGQATALSELVADVVAEKEARKAERAANAPALQALLEDYLAEVEASGAPKAATVSALRELREAHKPDREARRGDREAIKEEITSILSEEQGEILRSFRPMAELGPSPEQRAERMEHTRERMAERARERGHDGERIEERMERGAKRRERGQGRKNVRGLLFSTEMLALLK